MRAERPHCGPSRAAVLIALLVVAGSFACSVEYPSGPSSRQDPAHCLLLAREAMDAGRAATALRWSERGIASDPEMEWPELREEAARAAFALGGGNFPNLLDAAAWVLEGGLAGTRPPDLPRWPSGPGSGEPGIDASGRELLGRLSWDLVERAARHLDALTAAVEDGQVPLPRLEGRLTELYLSHSALRLATGLVLLFDGNGDLADGLQDPLHVGREEMGIGSALDSLLIAGQGKILEQLHRSLLSAENLRRVRGGERPLGGSHDGFARPGSPLDPSVPLDAYVGAVRAVVGWIDRAASGEGTKDPEEHESDPSSTSLCGRSAWSLLLDLLVPAATAAPLPIQGSLRAPAIEPLASSQDGFQPAGLLPDDGWRIGAGQIGWSEGTVASLRAILEAQGILEGSQGEALSEQLHAAAEASRLLERRVALVSIVPGRVGYRWRGVDVGLAPVADGLARSTTGTLGSPEGWGVERFGGDLHLLVQAEPLFGWPLAAGLGLLARPRWERSTHLQIVPEAIAERSGWERGVEADLRLGIASRGSGARLQWGALLNVPLEGEGRRDPARLWARSPHLSLAARLRGPRLGRARWFGLLCGSADDSRAEGRIGAALAYRDLSLLLLRAEAGWEGELRWGPLLASSQLQRTPGGTPLRTYRLGVSR